MSVDEHRRKVRDLFAVAQLLPSPGDSAAMIALAAYWMERAEEAEQAERIVQRRQQLERTESASKPAAAKDLACLRL